MSEMTFGERLQSVREARGFTKASLAKATGLAYNTIDRYEAGATYPDVPRLLKLAEALGVTAGYLAGGPDHTIESPRFWAERRAYELAGSLEALAGDLRAFSGTLSDREPAVTVHLEGEGCDGCAYVSQRIRVEHRDLAVESVVVCSREEAEDLARRILDLAPQLEPCSCPDDRPTRASRGPAAHLGV